MPTHKYTKEWLLNAIDLGAEPKFLYFWGHTPVKPGEPGKHVFSQWFPSPFVVDDRLYKTAEHWMMAAKARLFGDEALVAQILDAPSPGVAKALGREVARFDQDAWEANRYDLVVQGNIHKFGQHPDLQDFLLTTGDRVLVEASPMDAIWGNGLPADHKAAAQPHCWRGLNLLGFALMEVRDHLAA